MREIDLRLQQSCNRFVPTEFFAIVHRQATDLSDERPQR